MNMWSDIACSLISYFIRYALKCLGSKIFDESNFHLDTPPTRIEEESLHALWTPELSFTNALGSYHTIVDRFSAAMFVRETEPLPEDFSSAVEGEFNASILYV